MMTIITTTYLNIAALVDRALDLPLKQGTSQTCPTAMHDPSVAGQDCDLSPVVGQVYDLPLIQASRRFALQQYMIRQLQDRSVTCLQL